MATNKDKIRAAAQKYLQKGQIDKAIREFERLVEDDPNDVRTLLKIGDLHTRKGDQAAATKTYGSVAKYYSDQGFFLKAVAVYKQILKLDPSLVDINLRLAELYHQLGLMSDAISQYRSICEIYEKAERWDDCQQVLNKMLELEPNNLPARIKLAETHARAGRTEQAKTDFARAAQQLKNEGRTDDYIKVAERLVHVDPNDVPAARELAAVYIQKNDARRALAKLQVCFRADPKDVETLNLLGTAFEELGQTQKAVSVYKELAEVHAGAGNNSARQAALRKIATLDPATAAEASAMGGGSPAPSLPAATARPSTPAPAPAPARPVAQPVIEPELLADVEEVADAEEYDDATGLIATPLSPEEEAAHATPEDLSKLLVEADIYIKYGLRNKAIDHLEKVLAAQPHNREAQERYKSVLLDADDTAGAVMRLWDMAQTAIREGAVDLARGDLTELLSYDPNNVEARNALRRLDAGPQAPAPPVALAATTEPELEVEPGVEIDAQEEIPAVELEVEPQHAASTMGELSIEVEADAFAPQPQERLPAEISVELDTSILSPPEEDLVPAPMLRQPGVQLQAAPPSDKPRAQAPAARPEPELDPLEALDSVMPAARAPVAAKPAPQPQRPSKPAPEPQRPAAAAPQAKPAPEPRAAVPAAKPAPEVQRPATTRPAPTPARSPSEDLELDAYINDAVPSHRVAAKPAPEPVRAAAPPKGRAADLPSKIPPSSLPEPEPEAPPAEDELDLRAELDEVEFFLQQGLTDEAQEALTALMTFYPDHSGVMALSARLGGSAAPLDGDGGDDEPEPETVHIARVDADLQEEIEHTGVKDDDDFGMSFEDVFNQFKKGVAAQVDQEDYDTHYNLGIAYKEMGLLEDAIREFELTSRAPQLEINALMMMGLCQLERGSTDDALRCFMQGLSSARVTAREVVALRYEVGLAYESMGRYADAVRFYEKASAMDPTFRDVSNRLSEASEHIDEGPAASSGELDALLGDTPARKNAKISYL